MEAGIPGGWRLLLSTSLNTKAVRGTVGKVYEYCGVNNNANLSLLSTLNLH